MKELKFKSENSFKKYNTEPFYKCGKSKETDLPTSDFWISTPIIIERIKMKKKKKKKHGTY